MSEKTNVHQDSKSALEHKARRAARRVGLEAKKSRCEPDLLNLGGFMLVNLTTRDTVAGFHFDMTAEDVLKFCNRE
jgi:hypothetical protein